MKHDSITQVSVPFHFTKSSCDGTEFPFHVNSCDSITQVSASFHFTKSSCDGTEPITTPRGVRLPPRGPRRRDGRGVGRGRGDAPGPSVSLLRVARAIAKGFNSSNGGRWTPPRRGEHAPSVAVRGGRGTPSRGTGPRRAASSPPCRDAAAPPGRPRAREARRGRDRRKPPSSGRCRRRAEPPERSDGRRRPEKDGPDRGHATNDGVRGRGIR